MTATATKPKAKPAKLGAEKLTPEEQKRRFIEAAREAGAGEDEAEFDAALKRIAKAKTDPKSYVRLSKRASFRAASSHVTRANI